MTSRVAGSALVLLALAAPCASFGFGSILALRTQCSSQGRRASPGPGGGARAACMSDGGAQIPDLRATRREAMLAAVGASLLASAPALAGGLDETWDEVLPGSDGQGVGVKFSYPKSWKFERKEGTLLVNEEAAKACDADPDKCLLGEVFTRSPGGDSALLNVGTSGETDVSKIPFSFFKKQIFNRAGKFGAYGAPEDVKSLADKTTNGVRLVDVKFTAFSPGGASIGRRGIIAVQQAGPEAYMLVCTTSASRWKGGESLLREIASSFSATPTGATAPPQKKFDGVKKSMFAAQNEERKRLEKEREAEGIQ